MAQALSRPFAAACAGGTFLSDQKAPRCVASRSVVVCALWCHITRCWLRMRSRRCGFWAEADRTVSAKFRSAVVSAYPSDSIAAIHATARRLSPHTPLVCPLLQVDDLRAVGCLYGGEVETVSTGYAKSKHKLLAI